MQTDADALAPEASASLSGKYESIGHTGGSRQATPHLNQSTEEAKQLISPQKKGKLKKKDLLSFPKMKIIVKSTKTISFDE